MSLPRESRKLPTVLRIGYVTGMTHSDLKHWLLEVADERMVGTVSYAIHQHGHGLAYELHEGGHRTSVLAYMLREVTAKPHDYTPDHPLIAYARTAHGMLAIEAHSLGVGAMTLPDLHQAEGSPPAESSLTRTNQALTPVTWARWRKYKAAALAGFVTGLSLGVSVMAAVL